MGIISVISSIRIIKYTTYNTYTTYNSYHNTKKRPIYKKNVRFTPKSEAEPKHCYV